MFSTLITLFSVPAAFGIGIDVKHGMQKLLGKIRLRKDSGIQAPEKDDPE